MWNLRKSYSPVQPVVHPGNESIVYSEFLPDLQLQTFIYCYWELQTKVSLKEGYRYKIVADGCMDIFFELEKPHKNFVMGFCKKYTEFQLSNTFHYIGVRFFPAAFPLLFNIDASELSNRFEDLGNINPAVSNFISSDFQPGITANDAKKTFDRYFLTLISKCSREPDKRIGKAVKQIIHHHGSLRIENDLDIGLSPRQQRRLFNFYIGDTAKVFSKVVRFQRALKTYSFGKNSHTCFSDQDHFYDQSHFIKDFKNFYGATPGQAFKR